MPSKEYQRAWRARHIDKCRAYSRAYGMRNRARLNAEARAKYAANPALAQKERARKLQRRYGITIEQFDAIFLSQGSCCAGCGSTDPTKGWRPNKRTQHAWCFDHNHKTGKPRGVLCYPCNIALGILEDNFNTLITLAKYVKKHAR
jgi:Recombination endonuclease VII